LPETTAPPAAARRAALHVGGRPVDPVDGATFTTYEPATGRPLATVAEAGETDVDRAVAAARAALRGPWASWDPTRRAAALRGIAAGIRERGEEIAELESRDAGKPISDSRAQVAATADAFEAWAGSVAELRAPVVASGPGTLNYALREPIGVVGVIIPWNYPFLMLGLSVAPALCAGNAVVLKPAELTPLTALLLSEIATEAGLPPGVLNVVPGLGPRAGAALAGHPNVDMISFTGSTTVGREVAVAAARNLTRATLELGGKSPNVVFADADLDAAARAALFSFTVNQGQLCVAGTRLLVEEAVHDELVDRLVALAGELRVGDPLDPATQLGAVISSRQLARIEGYVEGASRDGATLCAGGARPELGGELAAGTFYVPTVFTGVRPDTAIAREEVFGPVLSVLPFAGEDDAVALANDVAYGLVASVWTGSLARAHRLTRAIDAGTVWVNTMHASSNVPHDYRKESGLGLVGGREQAETMTRLKAVVINVDDATPGW
jgi:acyl-CoA reductase-like NAD-dependent aldehyde dehydrogenase